MTFNEVSSSHWALPTCPKVISGTLLKTLLTLPSRIVAVFLKWRIKEFLVIHLSQDNKRGTRRSK